MFAPCHSSELYNTYYSQYYGDDRTIDIRHFNQPLLETEYEDLFEIAQKDLFNSVHEHLWDDENFVKQAVCYRAGRPCNFQYASRRLKENFNVVIEAVRKDYQALQFASHTLRSNREIVMEAVKINGYALQYANWHLRNSRNFVIEAVKIDCDALRYASDRLKDDIDMNMEIVRNYGLRYSLLVDLDRTVEQESYRRKKELILEVVKRFEDCSILFRQGERIPDHEDISMEILKNNPMTFRYLDDRLMIETRFMMTYLKHSPDAGAILDVENGMTALHFIFKSKALCPIFQRRAIRPIFRQEDIKVMLTRDFGDAISSFLQHPRGREAAFIRDRDGMTPLDCLCRSKPLDEMQFLPENSFAMLMVWWCEQMGTNLIALEQC